VEDSRAGRGLEVIFLDLESYKRFKTFISPAVFNHAICFVPDTSLLITAGGGFLSTNDTWTRPHGEMLQIWNLPKPLP
jgi:hypothetical protein